MPLLAWRLSMLQRRHKEDDTELYGRMFLSPAADALDIAWYNERVAPTNDLLRAHWARQDNQVWRIAMLLKLADYHDLLLHPRDESWRIIQEHHLTKAQALSDQLLAGTGEFMGQALTYQHSRGTAHVEDILRKRLVVQQTPELLRAVSRFGVKAKELEYVLQGLEDEQKVERTTQGNGKYVVKWIGGEG